MNSVQLMKPVKLNELVKLNEKSPVSKVVSWGRPHENNQWKENSSNSMSLLLWMNYHLIQIVLIEEGQMKSINSIIL